MTTIPLVFGCKTREDLKARPATALIVTPGVFIYEQILLLK
jgi:hypothetical protein